MKNERNIWNNVSIIIIGIIDNENEKQEIIMK